MKVVAEEKKEVWDLTLEFEDDERERLLAIAKRTMPKKELEDAMLSWCIRQGLLEQMKGLEADPDAEM